MTLTEKQLNVIRASGYIFGGILALQRAVAVVYIFLASAISFFTLVNGSDFTNPVLWAVCGVCIVVASWGFLTVIGFSEALSFTACMRNKDRVEQDTTEVIGFFENKEAQVNDLVAEFSNRLTSILSIEKVNKAALKDKYDELKGAANSVLKLRDTAEHHKSLFDDGLAFIDSLSSSFCIAATPLLALALALSLYLQSV